MIRRQGEQHIRFEDVGWVVVALISEVLSPGVAEGAAEIQKRKRSGTKVARNEARLSSESSRPPDSSDLDLRSCCDVLERKE